MNQRIRALKCIYTISREGKTSVKRTTKSNPIAGHYVTSTKAMAHALNHALCGHHQLQQNMDLN